MFRSMDGLPRSHEFDTKVKTPSSTNSPCPSTSRDQRELTPTKPIQTPQNQLSPQKRKFTVNADDSNANISPKIIKQEAVTSSVNQSNNVAMVTPRDKVKAALKFNNITVKEETPNKGTQDTEGNAGVKRETDDARTTCNEDEAVPNTAVKTVTNTIAKGKTDSIPEFAASLEDSNYLQALDDVENDIEKDKEKLGTMEKTNESIDVGKSIHFIGTSTNFPCYVSTSTGYYVKTANNSKNDTGSKKDGTNDKASSESKIDTPIDLTVSNNRNDVVAVTDESVVVNSKGKEFGKGSEELIANTNTVNDETKGDSDSVMKVENDGRIINVTNAPVENNEDHNESVTERKTDESKWISNSRYNSSSVTGRETHRPTTGTSIRASTNVFIKSINKTMLSSPLYITKPVSTTGMSSSTTHSVNSSTKPVSSNSGSFIRPQSNSISSSSFSKPLTMNSGSSATLPSNSTPNAAGSLTKPPSSNYGSPARHQSNSTLYATPLKRISNSNSGSFTPSKSVSPAGSAIPFPKPSPTSTYSPSKMSYKLDSIHARKFGALPAVSHSAEADCVTLLKVVKRTAESLEWLDDNAVLFSTVPLPF
ncbi:exodeoxyribonuclease III [Mactra antiquata]